MLAPRRTRCRPARSRGRSRSARRSAAPPSPGTRPASAIAIRPVARPNCENRSSARTARASMWSAGSKSSTWAATCDRNGDGSKRSMRLTGDAFARRPVAERRQPGADRRDHPEPGDPDLATASSHVRHATSPSSVARASASACIVASVRPAIGRVNTRSTNAANAGDARAEVVRDLDAGDPGAGRLDRPGHVHAPRRAGHVVEVQPPGRGLVPGPAAPRDRDPEPEPRDDDPPRDEVAHERAVGLAPDRPRPRVVGEQALPAGDVARQAIDEVGRRGDVDADGSSAPQRPARPRAQVTRSTSGQGRRAGRPGSMRRGRWSRRPRRAASPPVTVARYRMPTTWIRWPLSLVRARRTSDRTPMQAAERAPSRPVSSASSRSTPRPDPRRTRGRRRAASRHRARGVRARPGRAGRRRRPRTRRRRRAGPAGRRRRGPSGASVTDRGARRGTAGRGRGTRGRGRPSRGPSSHGCHPAPRDAARPARTAPAAAEEREDEARDDVLAREPARASRARRAGARRRAEPPSRWASMAEAARRAETSARWRPSPVNGSRNPAASPTTSQPDPARRATRLPSGLAPAIASRRRARRATPPATPGSGGIDAQHAPPRSRPRRPPPGGRRQAGPASTIPMFTRPPGTGAIPQ